MSECRCGRPTRDEAYVCDQCSDDLAKALGDVAWLADELETTITRQAGIDYRKVGGGKGGKKPAERPSPAHWGASEARTHLRGLLVSWALFCASEGVRHRERSDALPEDDLVALSRWLLWRVDGLALHDIGPEAVDEITSAVATCHRIIDRPAERQYLGDCGECGGDLYARPGGTWAACETCDQRVPAQEIRDDLLEKLDDRLCTAAEIARLSTFLGLHRDRESVRKLVNQWHTRRRIEAEPAATDEVLFRFGIVWRLLVADDGAHVKAG